MIQKRSLGMYILLTFVTCGIYGLFWFYCMHRDTKIITKDNEGISSGVALILNIITGGIYYLIWMYSKGNDLKSAGAEMNVPVEDNGATYLLWHIVGALIIVGPLVALAKFIKNFNNVAFAYNANQATAPLA